MFQSTLPLHLTVAITRARCVRVNRNWVGNAVQSARGVEIASASLLNCHISNRRELSFVSYHGNMTIAACYRVRTIYFVPVRGRRVNSRIFFFKGNVTVARVTRAYFSFSNDGRNQARDMGFFVRVVVRADGVRVLNGRFPKLSVYASERFRTITLVR